MGPAHIVWVPLPTSASEVEPTPDLAPGVEPDLALDLAPDLAPDLAYLSDAERARAQGLLNPRVRTRFVRCRSALRQVIGAEVGMRPESVQIVTSPAGKPLLEGAARGLHVSVSHSGTLGVVAWTDAGPCGVDLERVRPLANLDALARRVFEGDAVLELAALSEPKRLRHFFRKWTELEAQAKACGEGVFKWIERRDSPSDPSPPTPLWLAPLEPPIDYEGAVCVFRY